MIYRARIDLAFTEEKEARKAIEKALDVFPLSIPINPGTINEERGFITIEKCYHDEDPSKPCETLVSYSN